MIVWEIFSVNAEEHQDQAMFHFPERPQGEEWCILGMCAVSVPEEMNLLVFLEYATDMLFVELTDHG